MVNGIKLFTYRMSRKYAPPLATLALVQTHGGGGSLVPRPSILTALAD